MRAYKYKLIRFYVSEEESIAREREFAKVCFDGESVGHWRPGRHSVVILKGSCPPIPAEELSEDVEAGVRSSVDVSFGGGIFSSIGGFFSSVGSNFMTFLNDLKDLIF